MCRSTATPRSTGLAALKSTTYVEDVPSHGGCFTYWPRSHIAAHRFFQDRPETIDGSFMNEEEHSSKSFAMMYGDVDVGPATEFVGRAGDTILW